MTYNVLYPMSYVKFPGFLKKGTDLKSVPQIVAFIVLNTVPIYLQRPVSLVTVFPLIVSVNLQGYRMIKLD